MRKSVQFGMAALCFALTLASVTDTVCVYQCHSAAGSMAGDYTARL